VHLLGYFGASITHDNNTETAISCLPSGEADTYRGCQSADSKRSNAQVVESLIKAGGTESAAGGLVNDEFTRERRYCIFDLPTSAIYNRIGVAAEQLETQLVKVS